MAYVLKQMSLADKQKVVTDAKNADREKALSLLAERDFLERMKNWAIDEAQDAYLIAAPILVRRESMARPYYMYFKEKLYEVKVLYPFGDDVAIVDAVDPLLLPELQEQIRDAFAQFGRYGDGPTDKEGRPEYQVVPRFRRVGA